MLGTELGLRLPAGSGQLKKADVQEASKQAWGQCSSKDCRDKALKGEVLGGTAGDNS